MTLELHATPEEVMRAVETLRDFGRQRGLEERNLYGAMLSLEECASNIVDHALKRNADQLFRVQFDHADDLLTIELRDNGSPFDPTSRPDRELRAGDDDLPGGWGLHLVRRYMDTVRYRREGRENVLTLTARLPLASSAE
jgi:anti-sigma regulatory factor (Ser/Thr protein kinase)